MVQQEKRLRPQITIPKGIYDAIVALLIEDDQKIKAFTFCSQLLTYQEWNEDKGKEWVEFDRNRFRKEFGYTYLNGFIRPLEEDGIIEIKKKASKYDKRAFGYRVSEKLAYSCHELIDLDKYIHNTEPKPVSEHLKDFTAFVESINIPLRDLVSAVKEKIDSLPNVIVLNNDIPDKGSSYKYKTGNGKWDHKKVPTILKHASKHGKDAILYDDKIYVDEVDRFLANKKLDIVKGSKAILRNLGYKLYYAHTDNTGGRLHHNFTNFPSYLFDIVCKRNNLVELDLACAQPVMFSHIIGEDAAPLFYKKSSTGRLYSYIAQELYGSIKKEYIKKVKFLVMNAFFDGNPKYPSKHREQLDKVFPKILEAIKARESNDKEKLAVQLQRFESNLFIRTILPKLKEKGVLAITKHDAVIFKYSEEDLDCVIQTIQQIMNDNNLRMVFKGKIYNKNLPIRFDQNHVYEHPYVNTPKPIYNEA